jgi:hypothetical protein
MLLNAADGFSLRDDLYDSSPQSLVFGSAYLLLFSPCVYLNDAAVRSS